MGRSLTVVERDYDRSGRAALKELKMTGFWRAARDTGPRELSRIYPLPDLLAVPSFKVTANHSAKTICVAGVIQNIGYARVRNPFSVALGITYTRLGVTISAEQIFRITDEILPGEQIETPCMQRDLVYFDVGNSGTRYDFELIVDINGEVTEYIDSNNAYRYFGWLFLSPAAAKRKGDVVIDTSPSRGTAPDSARAAPAPG